jgi:hypothetical protein
MLHNGTCGSTWVVKDVFAAADVATWRLDNDRRVTVFDVGTFDHDDNCG